MTWYDGGMMPPRPAEFSDEMVAERNGRMVYKEQFAGEGGVMYFGTKGKLLHDTYGYKPRLLPQSLHDSYGTPKQKIKRIQTTHEMNWVEAAKGTAEASSPFEYAARLVEVMLLGVVSLRARSKIYYDAENMRVTNSAAGERLPPPRLQERLQADAVAFSDRRRVRHARRRAVNSQLRNSQLRNQLPTPNSQLPTPNSQLPTPNSQLPTPNSQLPTLKSAPPKSGVPAARGLRSPRLAILGILAIMASRGARFGVNHESGRARRLDDRDRGQERIRPGDGYRAAGGRGASSPGTTRRRPS